jgi:hypothetical protein
MVAKSLHLLVFWGGAQHGFNGFRHNAVDYAQRITTPTLLLHGERDNRVTADQARSVFDHLAGPKEFKLFAEVGHESYETRSPVEWRQVVGDFLDSWTNR